MKYVSLFITYLVGFVFVVFGLNYFFNFMPQAALTGDSKSWFSILVSTNFLLTVKLMEIAFGTMLLINFKRPLAWLLLLPIVVNIAMFEVFITSKLGLGVFLLILVLLMIYYNKTSYRALVQAQQH